MRSPPLTLSETTKNVIRSSRLRNRESSVVRKETTLRTEGSRRAAAVSVSSASRAGPLRKDLGPSKVTTKYSLKGRAKRASRRRSAWPASVSLLLPPRTFSSSGVCRARIRAPVPTSAQRPIISQRQRTTPRASARGITVRSFEGRRDPLACGAKGWHGFGCAPAKIEC